MNNLDRVSSHLLNLCGMMNDTNDCQHITYVMLIIAHAQASSIPCEPLANIPVADRSLKLTAISFCDAFT